MRELVASARPARPKRLYLAYYAGPPVRGERPDRGARAIALSGAFSEDCAPIRREPLWTSSVGSARRLLDALAQLPVRPDAPKAFDGAPRAPELAPSDSQFPLVGRRIPQLRLWRLAPDGTRFVEAPNALRQGKVRVLNLWSSWCPPCLAEMPILARIHQRLQQWERSSLLLITEDSLPEQTEAFLKAAQVDLRDVVYQSPLGEFRNALHPRLPLPVTVVTADDNRITLIRVGELMSEDEEMIVDMVERLATQ